MTKEERAKRKEMRDRIQHLNNQYWEHRNMMNETDRERKNLWKKLHAGRYDKYFGNVYRVKAASTYYFIPLRYDGEKLHGIGFSYKAWRTGGGVELIRFKDSVYEIAQLGHKVDAKSCGEIYTKLTSATSAFRTILRKLAKS